MKNENINIKKTSISLDKRKDKGSKKAPKENMKLNFTTANSLREIRKEEKFIRK